MRQVSCSVCNQPCKPKDTTIVDHKRICSNCIRNKRKQDKQFKIR